MRFQMSHWIIAAGRTGSLWDEFKKEKNIRLGFDEFDAGDLSKYHNIQQLYERAAATERSKVAAKMQWDFAVEMDVGDYVFVRQSFKALTGLGRVISRYRYEPKRQTYLHTRDVHWLRTGLWEPPSQAKFAQNAIVKMGSNDPRIQSFYDLMQFNDEDLPIGPPTYPDELPNNQSYPEGRVSKVTVNKYERDLRARIVCIQHYGLACSVCEFDFQKVYGEIGIGHIHVHHLIPISEVGEGYVVDPIKDLRPVCPNCHAMIHRQSHLLTIAELKIIMRDHG